MRLFIITILTIFLSGVAFSQEVTTESKKKKMHGTFYVTWGYHRDQYTNSDIHFQDSQTENYNFTLYNAKASDRLDFGDHFFDQPLTVPQYVFYGGYFFNNKRDLGIEIGWDHLKYIVNDNQVMHLKGTIHGVNYDQDTLVTPDFVHYEHTNGNNYLMASMLKRYKFYTSPSGNHRLSAIGKLGGGILIPKTDSRVLGNENDGPFRFSGIVVGSSVALRYDVWKYLFIESSVKGAFVDYTDVKLYGAGRAQQYFFSVQYIFSFGFNIPLSNQ